MEESFCLREWYYERNLVKNAFCKHIPCFEKRPKNIWQVGPLGWFQGTEAKFDFFKVPGGCFIDNKEGLNSQRLAHQEPGQLCALQQQWHWKWKKAKVDVT